MDGAAGIPLAALDATLTKVPVHLNRRPIASFDALTRMGPHVRAYMEARFDRPDVEDRVHDLPSKAFARLTVDETAKALHSAKYAIRSEVEEEFERDPSILVLRKIRSSMWRWSFRRAPWNEMVDAYNGIAAFDMRVDGLSVTLDHTTWYNECGRSQHSNTFLDGVFAFLVHFRGEHVMTIGFSITSGRRLLLQQVQLKKRAGNRWLFRMPGNRVEFVVDRLRAAFPRHRIHVVDGADVAGKSLRSYRDGHARAREEAARYAKKLELGIGERDFVERYHAGAVEELAEYAGKIAHLEAEVPRLAAFYRNAGRHTLGRRLRMNGLTHYAIAA